MWLLSLVCIMFFNLLASWFLSNLKRESGSKAWVSWREIKLKSKTTFRSPSRFLKSKPSIITQTAAVEVLKDVHEFKHLGVILPGVLWFLLACDFRSLPGGLWLSLKKKERGKRLCFEQNNDLMQENWFVPKYETVSRSWEIPNSRCHSVLREGLASW